MQRRVVITGLGPISPIGKERETFWRFLVNGISGIRVVPEIANSPLGFKTQIGGNIPDFDPLPYLHKKKGRHFSRFTQMAVVAAGLAIADAHLTVTAENASRVGVMMGTGIGGHEAVEEQQRILQKDGLSKINPFCANATFSHAAAAEISIYYGLTGVNYSLSTGCSASANALGTALDAIRSGKADVILAGGAETPFTEVVYASFDGTKQLSKKNATPEKAVTPYDLNRDGFLLAEGAGVVVLEELEHALRRGAYIYGELCGFGSSADAYDSYRMEPTGAGMARAMEAALRDADITPYELDYICSHGSGSKSADLKETHAIKLALGDRAKTVPVSTIKSVMGMPFGASTAFQLIAAALMLEKQIIIPTMNLETPDPECDLDYVPNVAREMILNYALLDSMGLGGNNAALVVKKYKADQRGS
ncbi:MAG: beta-ketoacyl-[acyl-carrier-protein] synthase family protein [Candidatus Margulisbacteria bacterium]|jgi:3-oxoacyl-[acyl-carrier-protein] synthase II|nr:beta-ketoacyl-[acyl-carrier-protein] synthase family protein [Candidatus Margulisiibacteriota bacterium]